MRIINGNTLNELVRISRKYCETGDTDILDKRNNLCDDLENQSKVKWIIFADLTMCFARLKISDHEICVVMKDLGFEIKKEGEA